MAKFISLKFPIYADRVAEVRFAARGITGTIRFTEVGDNVRIEANLQGLRGD